MRSLERVLGIALLGVVGVAAAQQLSQFYANGAASNAGYTVDVYGHPISLYGLGAAAGVLFEALLYPVGRYCMRQGYYAGAIIIFAGLATVLAYTAILDFESNTTSRLDRTAERDAVVDNRVQAKDEIDQLSKERQAWLARIENPHVTRKEVSDLSAKIDANNDRIDKLRRDVSSMKANAGGHATAATLSANFGYSEASLSLAIVLIKLIWPMFLRAFGLSIAIYAFEIANQPVKEAKTGTPLSPTVEPVVFRDAAKNPILAQERKPSKAIETLKANLLSPKEKSDPFDAAIEALKARKGNKGFTLDEVMGELAIVHAARNLPQPSQHLRKSVGKRLTQLGYVADRQKAYSIPPRGRNVLAAHASA